MKNVSIVPRTSVLFAQFAILINRSKKLNTNILLCSVTVFCDITVDFSVLNTHLCGKILLRHDYIVGNEMKMKSLPEYQWHSLIGFAPLKSFDFVSVRPICVIGYEPKIGHVP